MIDKMAKILKLQNFWDRRASASLGMGPYMEMYDELIGYVNAGRDLFLAMNAAFRDAAEEAGLNPDDFTLNTDYADALYALTMQWLMPLEDDEDPDKYELLWDLTANGYDYEAHAAVNAHDPSERRPVWTMLSRQDKDCKMEYRNFRDHIWEEDAEEYSD